MVERIYWKDYSRNTIFFYKPMTCITNYDLCRTPGHATQAKAGLFGTWAEADTPGKSSLGLVSMSRYSAQIIICL